MIDNRLEDKRTAMLHSLYTVKKGEVIFYEGDFNGVIFKRYLFEDCTVIHLREDFLKGYGMVVTMTLSPAIQKYNFQLYVKPWQESWRPPVDYKPPVYVIEDKNERIKDAYFAKKDNKGSYKRISSGILGSEVYIIVKTTNLEGRQLNIELFDTENILAKPSQPLRLLKRDTEVTELKTEVNNKGEAIVKVKLRPKSDEDLKAVKDNFMEATPPLKPQSTKVAKLYIKVSCKGNSKMHIETFLNGGKFEVKAKVIILFKGITANDKYVSEKTQKILRDVGRATNNMKIVITSTARTPHDQARIMYDNCKRNGSQSQLNIYAASGDAVVRVYIKDVKAGKGRYDVIKAMEEKIKEIGPTKVSKHCGDYKKVNIIDVSYRKLQNKSRFWKEMKTRPELVKMIKENNCYHIEIKQ